jgi:hypothetical protein
MSGVFHQVPSDAALKQTPSRMNIDQRRSAAAHGDPEWCLRGMSEQTKRSPLLHAAEGMGRGFVLAYAGKLGMGLLFALLGRKKKLADVLREVAGKDTVRFAAFFGLWNGLLRGANSALARVRPDDQYNALAAGAVAGLALLVDDVDRRRLVALYVFVRAMSVAVKGLSRERVLPYWEHAESALFGLVNGPIMYSFLLEPDIMDQGYYKWILNMGSVTHDGLGVTLRDRRTHLARTGELLPFVACQPHYHTGSCVGHCTSDWVLGLGRAAKIYLPVHLIPVVLFRYKKLMSDPAQQLLDTGRNVMLSCMFLTTYVFAVKFSQCMMRNVTMQDSVPQAFMGGFLTGLACLFERPSRVSELMLYCVPKSVEVCWNWLVKHHGLTPVPFYELPLFMLGSGILVAARREDIKSTYFNVLLFAIGADSSAKKSREVARQVRTVARDEEPEEE